MLMSLSKRYVFLAQKLAAATAFESAYGASCEIAVANDRGVGRHPVTDDSGRHDDYRTFLKIYQKLFEDFLSVDHFFVFGVVRDPMLRLHSIYQRRLKSVGRNDRRARLVGSFADFIENLINGQNGEDVNIPSQYSFFMDNDEAIAVNYLVRLEEMANSLQIMKEYTGLDFSEAIAKSQITDTAPTLSDPSVLRMIEESFARDFELYDQKTDRMLRDWNRSKRLDVEAALRWMAQAGNRFEVAGSMLYKLRLRMQNDKDFNLSELNAMIDAWEPFERSEESLASAGQSEKSVA